VSIDLMEFVDEEASRLPKAPISWQGFVYASDGKAVLRVPDDGQHGYTENAEWGPRFAKIIEDVHGGDMRPQTIAGGPPPLTECDDCDGRGYYRRDCEMCGPHKRVCFQCDGSGQMESAPAIDMGGWYLAPRYWRKLSALEGIVFGTPQEDDAPCPIGFDGGIGAVMPLVRKRIAAMECAESLPVARPLNPMTSRTGARRRG
jgi:hypothetical protein